MADIHYSGHRALDHPYGYGDEVEVRAGPEISRVTLLVNWAGALVSMGLVIGMGVWAWQLMMRDVTEVPVIRALEGPMRVAPTDPGGSIAENQGLAVNRLAEGAEAAPVPDQLVLAPAPTDLSVVPPQVLAPEAAPEEEVAFENASVASGVPAAEETAEAEVPAPGVMREDTAALIDRLLAEAQPLEENGAALPTMADTPEPGAAALLARAATIPVSIPGVRSSPRPLLRPASITVARAPVAADATVTEDGAVAADAAVDPDAISEDEGGFEIAAAELTSGTRLVQLGAYDTPELAREEWARLAQLYPDFFLGRARVIEQASSGGQTFYRLRAHGFGDLSASRRFCAALVAQGAACIPVTVR